MRRTISALSRELAVSRPCIYRALARLGIKTRSHGEYDLNEWELLKEELTGVSEVNKRKRLDADKVVSAGRDADGVESASDCQVKIADINCATLLARLQHAKQEFDFNKGLILKFQRETDAFFREHGSTTVTTHNGTMASIPSVISLDKYVKLNVSLSKLISELECELDLDVEGGDDPCA